MALGWIMSKPWRKEEKEQAGMLSVLEDIGLDGLWLVLDMGQMW